MKAIKILISIPSKDVTALYFVVDVNLPFLSEQFLNNATVMLITITIISIVFPYFLIAMVPICIVFILLYKICQRGIRGLKRLVIVVVIVTKKLAA